MIKSCSNNLFQNNYAAFLKNMLNLAYKIKFSYDLKLCKPLDSENNSTFYVELSSNVRDIFNYSSKNVIESFLVDKNKNSCVKLSSSSTEESGNIYFRLNCSNDDKLEIKFVKNSKNDKETNLEIWYESLLLNSSKLEEFNITRVYFDDVFGKPKFSRDGKKIIFIAEIDSSKNYKNYFNIVEENVNGEGSCPNQKEKTFNNLNKFEYKQDFGECLKDKSSPRIFIYEIENNKFYHLNLENYPEIFPTNAMFDNTNNDVVFSGYEINDMKLGLIYCLNRKSSIYLVKNPILEEMKIKKPSSDKEEKTRKFNELLINLSSSNNEYCNMFPIFSPNFQNLVWFANEKATPHMNGLKLYVLNWDTKKLLDEKFIDNDYQKDQPENVIEKEYSAISNNVKLLINKIQNDNDYFNGIFSYEDNISLTKFISDNLLILASQHKNTNKVFMYDINKNRLTLIPYNINSKKLVSVGKGLLFTLDSDVNILPHINLININIDEYNKEEDFEEISLENGNNYLTKYNLSIFNKIEVTKNNKDLLHFLTNIPMADKTMSNYMSNIIDDVIVDDLCLNGVNGHFIYLKSMLKDKETIKDVRSNFETWKTPIIYFLHGGPNSAIGKMFLIIQLIFLAHGYSVLVINYPGSTGYGQKYLSSLNGNIGKIDVKTCGEFLLDFFSVEKYKNFIDEKNVMLYGGSHGGYLSCWLIVHEKYRKMFSSAAIRNPVTDLISSMATSDIPDWVLGQATDLDMENNFPPDKNIYNEFYDASPVFLAKNCSTPSLICLGKIDKRVSLFNGLYFYEAIKRNKCETRLLLYPEDGHPLSTVETEIDCIFNICYWFETHLK